jgi:hypothetical protein
MPSSRKNVSSRPPLRVKSALPAPRVAPRRVHVPVLRRRPVQVVLAVVALVVAAFVVRGGLQLWRHHTTTAHQKAAVKRFDSQFRADLSPLSTVFSQQSSSPQSFLAGSLPQAQFVSQTAQWLATLRAFSGQMTSASPPQPLLKARAVLVQAANLFIDSIKVFQTAGTTTDLKGRTDLVQQGNNIWSHATAVLEDGVQEETTVLNDFHLPLPSGITPANLKQPPSMPPEVSSPSPQPLPSASAP